MYTKILYKECKCFRRVLLRYDMLQLPTYELCGIINWKMTVLIALKTSDLMQVFICAFFDKTLLVLGLVLFFHC
jgi:hypothetical protein